MNYPNGIIKPSIFKNITYKNRGISLENDLNITNNYYSDNKIAYIYKKPTPIKVVKVVFDKNNKQIDEWVETLKRVKNDDRSWW